MENTSFGLSAIKGDTKFFGQVAQSGTIKGINNNTENFGSPVSYTGICRLLIGIVDAEFTYPPRLKINVDGGGEKIIYQSIFNNACSSWLVFDCMKSVEFSVSGQPNVGYIILTQ